MKRSGYRDEPSPDDYRVFDRAMLDAVHDVLFAFTPGGEIVRWNQRVNEITGYSDEEVASMPPVEFVPEKQRARVAEKLAEVLRAGNAVVRAHLLTRDGRLLPYEFTGSLMERDGQKLICGVGRDISERVGRAEELRESEQKYRRLFRKSNDGIAITTPDGSIVDANPAVCRLSGYSREEILQMEVSELYQAEHDREIIMRRLRDQGEIRNFTVRARRKDGEIITCQLSSTATVDDEGNVQSIQSIIRDVSKEKKVQRELEESEEKFRTLAEKALVGIYLMQDGVYQYVNPAYARIVERTPDELIGEDPLIVLHPDEYDRARAKVKKRYSGDSDEGRGIYRLITKSGETIVADINGIRITYRGRPAVIGTASDITDRRRMQREILEIQEEERRRMGQDLHDGIASELTGTAMLAGAAEEQARGKVPDLVDTLAQIRAQLRASVESVRRISRGLNPVTLEGGGLPEALERLASNAAIEEETVIEFESEGDLEELSTEPATHLYWIAQEAVSNARKHAEADRLTVRLHLEDGDLLLLRVSDDGRGFDLDRVEDDSMGLRTMQYRAELMGGRLAIETASGEGTTLRVRIPVG